MRAHASEAPEVRHVGEPVLLVVIVEVVGEDPDLEVRAREFRGEVLRLTPEHQLTKFGFAWLATKAAEAATTKRGAGFMWALSQPRIFGEER